MLVRNHRPSHGWFPSRPRKMPSKCSAVFTGRSMTRPRRRTRRGGPHRQEGQTRNPRRTAQSVGFLIDTSLWIAIERGRLSAADIHAITRQEPDYLFAGHSRQGALRHRADEGCKAEASAMTALRRMRRKPLLRITGETAEVFGMIAAKLTQAGRGARTIASKSLAGSPSHPARFHRAHVLTPRISRMPGAEVWVCESAGTVDSGMITNS